MVVLTPDFIDLNTEDSHTFRVDTTGTADTVLAKSDGTIEYSANASSSLTAGETAMDTFTYTVTDAAGKSSTATASVLINWLNDDVVAADDTFDGTEDVTITLSPLANDFDSATSATLKITQLFDVSNGQATIAENSQTITFIPAENFEGETALD